ncbi:hypothetical protein B0H13DRAFT_2465955 [Mycena leptocephala]|nr:hypothetical protein B0H13DRAFT_2465955 [Mycena leptocephala]
MAFSLQDTYPTRLRRSFQFDRSILALHCRTHSDTTASRPQLMLQSDQLQSSALKDGSSPIEPSPSSSFSSFPAHGGQDPYSPVPPWAAGDFLGLPNYGPDASEASSNGSPTPNSNWDYVDPFRRMSDDLQHPPMLAEWRAGDHLAVPSSATMYRNPASSFDGSETNPSWDHGSSFVPSGLGAVGTSVHDKSPKRKSWSDTKRSGPRRGHELELPDLFKELELQDGANQTEGSYFKPGFAFVYPSTWTDHRDHGPSHLARASSQQLPGIAIAGASEGFSAEGGISAWSGEPAEEEPLFRLVVGTEAGRNAATNRRKDKTNPAPFVCGICGADFTSEDHLQSQCFFLLDLSSDLHLPVDHESSHNSDEDFKCEMCEQVFTTKHVLERHARKCNTKPY